MLVAIAVAAVLVGLAAPPMQRVIVRHALAGQADDLRDALLVARSEAMKRGGPVILCKTDPLAAAGAGAGAPCSTDSRVGWQTWMVFADANRSGAYDAGEPQIRVQDRPPAHMTVTSDPALHSVRFESTGIARANTGTADVAFVVAAAAASGADPARTDRRTVCLNSSGRAVVIDDGTCP